VGEWNSPVLQHHFLPDSLPPFAPVLFERKQKVRLVSGSSQAASLLLVLLDPKSQFYVRIPPPKPKHAGRFCEFVQSTLLQDSANTRTHSERFCQALSLTLQDSANTRIHSERFCQLTLVYSPRFCEYASSLWHILRVTLVCSPRFCDYAHSLWKILRVLSIQTPRFCEYGHSLYKIPQVLFTFAFSGYSTCIGKTLNTIPPPPYHALSGAHSGPDSAGLRIVWFCRKVSRFDCGSY
jgi:hypothetical protein